MASNSLGQIFRITTWGESHGKAIGVLIDGCPAGLHLTESTIQADLARRAPGKSAVTSPRKESDQAEILSGTFQGMTTGAPIMIMIPNTSSDASHYEPIKDLMRPGHANFTYLEKYGVFDYRGGGRSSARETASRVAAGAVAKIVCSHYHITIQSGLVQVAHVAAARTEGPTKEMVAVIQAAQEEGDSVGGVIEFQIDGVPVGLGDPMYEKLEANLAKAMLSIPATKGFEMGEGFSASGMKGSEHNDAFEAVAGQISLKSNRSGGTLGGISTGSPIIGRVAFKPTSSIQKEQKTVDREGKSAPFTLPAGSRHDPCVAIRAVPIVEAMAALVMADACLMNLTARLP